MEESVKTTKPGRGRWKIRPDQYEDLLNLYRSGKTMKEVAKHFGVYHKAVTEIFKKLNVTPRGCQKFIYNKDYFKNIDTPAKAYFLGFMFTDGSVERNKRTARLTLQDRDSYILERFAKELFKNERPLYEDFRDFHRYGGKRRKKYALKICCQPLVADLIEKGCVPNKSFVLKFPAFLMKNEVLLWHFIRGIIDGDGCLHITKRSRLAITFLGSSSMVKGLRMVLQRRDIKSTIRPYRNIWHLRISVYSNKLFLDKMYKDSEGIRLERKYNKSIDPNLK